jgi:hypothetical protein
MIAEEFITYSATKIGEADPANPYMGDRNCDAMGQMLKDDCWQDVVPRS